MFSVPFNFEANPIFRSCAAIRTKEKRYTYDMARKFWEDY